MQHQGGCRTATLCLRIRPPYLWFHGFIKHVNMGSYLCLSADTSIDVLFECKIPNPDGSHGTPVDEYVINHHLVAKLCFTVACSL